MKLNNLVLSAAMVVALGMVSSSAVFASDYGKSKETGISESSRADLSSEKHDTGKHPESNSKDDNEKLESRKHDKESTDNDSEENDEAEAKP